MSPQTNEPLINVSSTLTQGKYIDFRLHGISVSGKTKIWVVQNRDFSTVLGRIEWFGRWRKYTFQPYPDMVFEQVCLRDIANFCEQETKAQMQRAAEAREVRPRPNLRRSSETVPQN